MCAGGRSSTGSCGCVGSEGSNTSMETSPLGSGDPTEGNLPLGERRKARDSRGVEMTSRHLCVGLDLPHWSCRTKVHCHRNRPFTPSWYLCWHSHFWAPAEQTWEAFSALPPASVQQHSSTQGGQAGTAEGSGGSSAPGWQPRGSCQWHLASRCRAMALTASMVSAQVGRISGSGSRKP